MYQFITLLTAHNAKHNIYYKPDEFPYHFDELSSHTTVALAQP